MAATAMGVVPQKRSSSGREMPPKASSNEPSPFLPSFEQFRVELDEHYDRRERVIKSSRGITAASKKMIFALQRTKILGQPVPDGICKAIQPHLDTIVGNFRKISSDLQGVNSRRYERTISGGIQEFLEALSFKQYLETQTLITPEQASSKLQSFACDRDTLQLIASDYLLGLFDMTGELMRFAITTMATLGALPGAAREGQDNSDRGHQDKGQVGVMHRRNMLQDLQEMRARLETLDTNIFQYDKKLDVTRASVDKVEKALYGLVVRGSERPKGWVPDISDGRFGGGEEGNEPY